VPGEALLHPLAIAAIAVLIVNDHFLKAAWPGPITGKISDFAGLIFFPLLLVGMWHLVTKLFGKSAVQSTSSVGVAVVLTGFLFVSVKLWPDANQAVASVMGAGQWLVGLLVGHAIDAPKPVAIAMDATDLVALPVLAVAYANRRPPTHSAQLMTRVFWRKPASIVAFVFAAAATIATSGPASPGIVAQESFHIALSADHPYELRQVDIAVQHGDSKFTGVTLSYYALTQDPSEYWVAFLPQSDGEPVQDWTSTMISQDISEPISLDGPCLDGCAKSYMMLIGRRGGTASTNGDFQVSLGASYGGSQATPVAGASVDVTVSEDRSGEMGVSELRTPQVSGELVIKPSDEPVWSGTLRVSGAPPFKEGVGLLELHLDATRSDENAQANVAINVAGAYILVDGMYADHLSDVVSVEWLQACEGETECDLPVRLETSWEPSRDSAGSLPQAGSVSVNFSFNATLIYVGRTTAPTGASLELSGQ
jgi:hypothetical protein